MQFVAIKQQENITELLHVTDVKVSSDDQSVGNILIHADSVEHVKLIKVKIFILLSNDHYNIMPVYQISMPSLTPSSH